MKLSDRDLKLLVGLLLVAIIVCPIFFIIRPYNDKIAQRKQTIETKKEREAFLAKLDANREFYNNSIALLDSERGKIVANFAEGFWDENNVFFLADIEDSVPIAMNTIDFAMAEPTQISEDRVDPATGEVIEGLSAVASITTIQYAAEYEAFKGFLAKILDLNKNERMVVYAVSADQDDETGLIKGTIVLNRYAVTGEGRSLAPASEESIPYGTDNVFGRPSGIPEEEEEAPAEE
ncbi:MAG: hypothetical protein IKI20_09890 [Lachnospiraceae bacterium]|nr:hypothetical protein [Lachnospiraceae bacterium]